MRERLEGESCSHSDHHINKAMFISANHQLGMDVDLVKGCFLTGRGSDERGKSTRFGIMMLLHHPCIFLHGYFK